MVADSITQYSSGCLDFIHELLREAHACGCARGLEKDSGCTANGMDPGAEGFFSLWNEAEGPTPLAQLALPEFLDS